jgi:large subunit ribosomal protein L30
VPSKAKAGQAGRAGKATKPKATKRAKRPAPRAKAEGGAKIVVRQVRSGIGHAETYKRTLKALGLRHQAEIVIVDNPSVRGMLTKVHHLVTVRPQGA